MGCHNGYGQIEHVSSVTIAVIVLIAGLTSFSGTDAVFDSLISLSTLVAAAVSMLWNFSIEGWLGVVIGARIDSELSVKLKSHISEYPDVMGAYDLALHRYGPERIIGSVHVELPDAMSAREIHRLTRSITEDVYLNYGIILTVGIYATNTDNEIYVEMKNRLTELMSDYPEILQMHGFYVDVEKKQVSFDIIIDFESERKMEIRDALIGQMKQYYTDYDFVVILDSDFSD